jgi:hypothetical protein
VKGSLRNFSKEFALMQRITVATMDVGAIDSPSRCKVERG